MAKYPRVYYGSLAFADERGEKERYAQSEEMGDKCRDAIEEALSRHRKDRDVVEKAYRDVVREFGAERVFDTTIKVAYSMKNRIEGCLSEKAEKMLPLNSKPAGPSIERKSLHGSTWNAFIEEVGEKWEEGLQHSKENREDGLSAFTYMNVANEATVYMENNAANMPRRR
jgi:hypothetical protein